MSTVPTRDGENVADENGSDRTSKVLLMWSVADPNIKNIVDVSLSDLTFTLLPIPILHMLPMGSVPTWHSTCCWSWCKCSYPMLTGLPMSWCQWEVFRMFIVADPNIENIADVNCSDLTFNLLPIPILHMLPMRSVPTWHSTCYWSHHNCSGPTLKSTRFQMMPMSSALTRYWECCRCHIADVKCPDLTFNLWPIKSCRCQTFRPNIESVADELRCCDMLRPNIHLVPDATRVFWANIESVADVKCCQSQH